MKTKRKSVREKFGKRYCDKRGIHVNREYTMWIMATDRIQTCLENVILIELTKMTRLRGREVGKYKWAIFFLEQGECCKHLKHIVSFKNDSIVFLHFIIVCNIKELFVVK